MNVAISRLLLAVSALICALGGVMHARAYRRAVQEIAAVALPPFYAGSFRALWLIDSATLIALAALFGLIAARPAFAAPAVLIVLAFIPGATAVLVYGLVGPFPPVYMLMTAAIMTAAAGALRLRD
jgi:hypothetical protein